MPQIEIPAEDPCLSMEIQDLDIVIVSKQEFPRKSEHYDCDAELAREYIDPITMSKNGSGRNRCVESGLAIDASPVQINTAWLRWLIDGRANQFAKKTNGFC